VGPECQASTGTAQSVTTLRCRIIPYFDQGDACGAAGPASAPGLALEARLAHARPHTLATLISYAGTVLYAAVFPALYCPGPDHRAMGHPTGVARDRPRR
jgi:hypothetical protein